MSGKHLLFAGVDYEARGGWRDHIGEFDTLDEARAVIDSQYDHVFGPVGGYRNDIWSHTSKYDWAHVIHEGQCVAQWRVHDKPGHGDGWASPDDDWGDA